MARLQLKRGLKSALPSSGLLAGEPLITTDKGELFIATGATTTLPVVPAIGDLTAIGTISGAEDALIIFDASTALSKKVVFNDFKTALNIPEGAEDEKVAVVSGGTAGYLWGTDGTDGVLRMNTSMSWTKDSGNGFVTLAVGTVDGGTF
jgi:hypothetical protein